MLCAKAWKPWVEKITLIYQTKDAKYDNDKINVEDPN